MLPVKPEPVVMPGSLDSTVMLLTVLWKMTPEEAVGTPMAAVSLVKASMEAQR